jgi:hypothetical protein
MGIVWKHFRGTKCQASHRKARHSDRALDTPDSIPRLALRHHRHSVQQIERTFRRTRPTSPHTKGLASVTPNSLVTNARTSSKFQDDDCKMQDQCSFRTLDIVPPPSRYCKSDAWHLSRRLVWGTFGRKPAYFNRNGPAKSAYTMKKMKMKKKKARVRQPRSWERADYKLAVATLILFAFFLVGGLASWLTSGKPTAAAEPSTVMRSGAQ